MFNRRSARRLAGVSAPAMVLFSCLACGGGAGDSLVPPLTAARVVRVTRATLVPTSEMLAGRTLLPEGALLLTGAPALVVTDTRTGEVSRHPVTGIREGEHPWGLARLANGELWTLVSPYALARLDQHGKVLERIKQASPRLGLFAFGEKLIFQVVDRGAGRRALAAGAPGDATLFPFGSLIVRGGGSIFDEKSSLNLVACGASVTADLPCWFAEETNVHLITAEGLGRSMDLASTSIGNPAIVEGYRHPIRDVYVDAAGTIWTLWTAADQGRDANYGWRLSRHDRHGRLLSVTLLVEPARVILRAEAGACRVLTRDGHILEIVPA